MLRDFFFFPFLGEVPKNAGFFYQISKNSVNIELLVALFYRVDYITKKNSGELKICHQMGPKCPGFEQEPLYCAGTCVKHLISYFDQDDEIICC